MNASEYQISLLAPHRKVEQGFEVVGSPKGGFGCRAPGSPGPDDLFGTSVGVGESYEIVESSEFISKGINILRSPSRTNLTGV
jgi:hypothetical protein